LPLVSSSFPQGTGVLWDYWDGKGQGRAASEEEIYEAEVGWAYHAIISHGIGQHTVRGVSKHQRSFFLFLFLFFLFFLLGQEGGRGVFPFFSFLFFSFAFLLLFHCIKGA
jgi:hypothetical protein